MNLTLYLATGRGLAVAGFDGENLAVRQYALEGFDLTAVAAAANGLLLAGTEDGVHRSTDGGDTWRAAVDGPQIRHVRWLYLHPDHDRLIFAGTEPAGIFVSEDGGASWTGRPEVVELRDQLGWWLPYSPESGCVRGFAFHGDRGYAAVEVGGVLRTDDCGDTWRLAPGSTGQPQFREPAAGHIHADVHSVEVHPASADLVFAATNAGLYRSRDGGRAWERINADGYTRALWLDPDDPEHLITGPAASVGRGGTVLETRDAGKRWEPLINGLSAPLPDSMVERFAGLSPDHLLAVLSTGGVRILDRRSGRWHEAPGLDAAVRAIAIG